jgi:hypothetical protein
MAKGKARGAIANTRTGRTQKEIDTLIATLIDTPN